MKIGLSAVGIQRGRSGLGQYVLGLVDGLIRVGGAHELVVFALAADVPLFARWAEAVTVVAVPETHRPRPKDLAWHQLTLPRLAREARLDVLHVPSIQRLLWAHPCPLVGTIHDLAPFRSPLHREWSRCASMVVTQLAARQDAVVAVSASAAADLQRLCAGTPVRATVVPGGVDHLRFTPQDRDAAARQLACRHSLFPPFFLCVSRLEHPAKNHLRLIAAFNEFKTACPSPWQLVLLGEDGDGAEKVHAAVRRSPYAQDIRCPGYVSAAELPLWYRSAGLLAATGLTDGFALAPLEAIACGCPVLASQGSTTAELCADAALVADPDDVGSLRRALQRVAADPDLRTQLGHAGIARAAQFDWRKTAASLLEIYHRIARPRPVTVIAGAMPTAAG